MKDARISNYIIDGVVSWVRIESGGTAMNTTVNRYGDMFVSNGGNAGHTTVNSGGIMQVAGGITTGTTVDAGGLHTVSDEGTAARTTVSSGGSMVVESGGTAARTVVSSGGIMQVAGGGVHRGILRIDSGAMVSALSGSIIDFTLAGRTANDEALINDWSLIAGAPTYTVTVSSMQAAGSYRLAQGAEGFTGSISIGDGIETYGSVTVDGESLVHGDHTYSLTKVDNTLLLNVAGEDHSQPYGDSTGADWRSLSASEFIVEYSTDAFARTLTVRTTGTAIDHYGMEGDFQWRVNNIPGNDISAGGIPQTPRQLQSEANGALDLFFANSDGVWEGNRYCARHTGTLDGWQGTGELVHLKGKNRIADVFAGSADANILVLTDDANGDALFIDDVYTELPDGLSDQARMSQIKEIRAGAGDDVVDLTSQQFAYTNGLTVCGGDGNDVIWANTGNNRLFGDAGNDRIIGAAGDDLIVGGIGNDAMHGGGGNDVFTFCANWGTDTVEQLAGGSVTLWFASGTSDNWNASTLTYSDGTDSVTVSGIAAENITLKFGDDSPDYAALSAAGAFTSAVSEKIFEDPAKGMLA